MKKVSVSNLVKEDVQMLLRALSIAFEDGSIYGGTEEGDLEHASINDRGDVLQNKLLTALRKTGKG